MNVYAVVGIFALGCVAVIVLLFCIVCAVMGRK